LVGVKDAQNYSHKWLKRGFLRLRMQSYDKKLQTKELTVRDFMMCFPDQHKRIRPLLSDPVQYRSAHTNSSCPVEEALKQLNYQDDADFFNMHSCWLDCLAVQNILRSKQPGWCKRNLGELQKTMDKYHKKHKIWPHPAILFELCQHLS